MTPNLCGDPSECSVVGKPSALHLQEEERCGEQHQSQAMIDILPDNVLLEIFDFYKEDDMFSIRATWISTWMWKTLIQVCRRWRCVIFRSPLRLDLRLVCTDTRPTTTSLDIWPPFPISIDCWDGVNEKTVENVIAAVKHGNERISHISFDGFTGSALKKLVAVMQQPLPALTHFCLKSYDESAPMLPETFLGGSAPQLEMFSLYGIPFPTFPQFIASSTHIRSLSITSIPYFGYIPPDAMVACLAALPNLEFLSIKFRLPLSWLPQITPPPRTRIVLSALMKLSFCGFSEYFEDFIAQIDAPFLKELIVKFFVHGIIDIPRLQHFISRAERLEPFDHARVVFNDEKVWISVGFPHRFRLQIRCEWPRWQLSSMVQIFGQQLPLLSHVERLEIIRSPYARMRRDNPDMDSSLWLELFHLFIAVQCLCVSEKLVPPVAAALQGLTGERTMEVLPVLRRLFLEGLGTSGPIQEGIRSFVASRQQSDHPVAVQSWERQ